MFFSEDNLSIPMPNLVAEKKLTLLIERRLFWVTVAPVYTDGTD